MWHEGNKCHLLLKSMCSSIMSPTAVATIMMPSSAVGNTLNTEEWCKQKGKCEIQILYSSASKVCCWGKDINIVPGKHCFQYHYAPLWSLFRLAFINGPCFYLHFNRKAVCVCVCVFINYTHTHHGSYAVLGCKKSLNVSVRKALASWLSYIRAGDLRKEGC